MASAGWTLRMVRDAVRPGLPGDRLLSAVDKADSSQSVRVFAVKNTVAVASSSHHEQYAGMLRGHSILETLGRNHHITI